MNTTPRGGIGEFMLVVLGALALFFVIGAVLTDSGERSGDSSSKQFSFFNFEGDIGGPDVPRSRSTRSRNTGAPVSEAVVKAPTVDRSPYADKVKVRIGNADTEEDVQREYITLHALPRNEAPISITGWKVQNAERVIEKSSGRSNVIPADTVVIPKGAAIVRNTGNSPVGDIILNPGDVAYLITGEAPEVFPALLNVSFRTNVCVGYFADDYDFTPPISERCPNPEDVPGASTFGNQCFDFIEDIRDCEVPSEQELIEKGLSNSCRTFIQDTYDYQGCVTAYKRNPDFLDNEWYVYLEYLVDELWHESGDTITIFDKEGRIVDWLSYD